jgi:hypothetical protein
VIGCHYRRLQTDGDAGTFDSTDFTRSNWDPDIQHGSPPLALLTKAIEELAGDAGRRIARIGLDILGPIPVAPVGVRAWVERPGSRIALYAAEMLATRPDGTTRPVARATAWLLATSDTSDVAFDRYPPLVEGDAIGLPPSFTGVGGYIDAVSWRRQATAAGEPAVYWLRPLVHVVDTDEATPVQKLAEVVDSANGVGPVLDAGDFVFMNTDTVVHLHRLPIGEDFGLRARGSIGPDGIGATTAEIFDRTGFIGTCAQTILVQRR